MSSPTRRAAKLDKALGALQAAETLMDEAQEFSDCVGDRPDPDACLELAILQIQQAATLGKWALALLEEGVAVKEMP